MPPGFEIWKNHRKTKDIAAAGKNSPFFFSLVWWFSFFCHTRKGFQKHVELMCHSTCWSLWKTSLDSCGAEPKHSCCWQKSWLKLAPILQQVLRGFVPCWSKYTCFQVFLRDRDVHCQSQGLFCFFFFCLLVCTFFSLGAIFCLHWKSCHIHKATGMFQLWQENWCRLSLLSHLPKQNVIRNNLARF